MLIGQESTEFLAKVLPSAKRWSSGCSGASVYPYYAGFTLPFARAVLQRQGLAYDKVVLDPWNGVGTTLAAASSLGLRAVGVDLNPFACMAARAGVTREGAATGLADHGRRIAERAKAVFVTTSEDAPIRDWLGSKSAQSLQALLRAIDEIDSGAVRRLLKVVLIREVKDLALGTRFSNPSWPTRPKAKRFSRDMLVQKFVSSLERIESESDDLSARRAPTVVRGDSRSLPLPSDSVSFVLTSPPYCTRIDYAATTAFELAAIGLGREQFGVIRKELTGTTAIRARELEEPRESWPASVRDLLRRVRSHPSHGSKSYYYKNLYQYFDDMMKSLNELRRVLAEGATGLMVLQTSYYKEIEIRLPELFVDMASAVELQSEVVCAAPVTRVMTTINSNSRRHLDSKEYVEALVAVKK